MAGVSSSAGLDPSDFAYCNGKLLFQGYDINNHSSLWVTDGTAAGTVELSVTGVNSSYSLSPSSLISYNGKVLFQGYDNASDYPGLWVTDGTAAGTSELSVIGSSYDLNPSDFTPYNGKVLFQGNDASNNSGLWVTDGTGAGTFELSVDGASSTNFSPYDFTPYNGKVLFQGYDASGNSGLWETDGTAAGTSELSVAGASSTGLSPISMTAVDIAPAAACYGPGTLIATKRSQVAVESLMVGDHALTPSGRFRPIVWIGFRNVEIAGHPRPWDVMPVRVQAHAFGSGQPARDLTLSPDHAVSFEDVLIPIRYLLNGASIRQESVSRITWWHVELDSHDLILAEGLSAESYLDTGNRSAFANGGLLAQAQPDFARAVWANDACAELVLSGPAVARARAGLLDRLASLGHATTDDPDLRLMYGDRPLATQTCGDWVRVVVPNGAGMLRIVSSSAYPAELVATSDDWRRLGVALVAWRVDGKTLTLDDAKLSRGWHPAEPNLRWTGGDATLDVPAGSVVELCLRSLLRFHVKPHRSAFEVDCKTAA